MWPVGVLSTATGLGDALPCVFESVLARHAPVTLPDASSSLYSATFPASYSVTLSFLVFGALAAGWPPARTRQLADGYLSLSARQKVGDLLNGDQRNVLLCESLASEAHSSLLDSIEPSSGQLALVNKFSALALAAAESVYFQFHRIATEKHGPYNSPTGSGSVLFRSIQNLPPPPQLWPELASLEFKSLSQSFDIAWRMRTSEFFFDPYSNLFHDQSSVRDTLAVAIRSDEGWMSLTERGTDVEAIARQVSADLERMLRLSTEVVARLSRHDLQRRLIGSLLFANRALLSAAQMRWDHLLDVISASRPRSGHQRMVPGERAQLFGALTKLLESIDE